MVSGEGGCAPVVALQEWENLVFFKISLTSEFLFTSSPSFSPDVKCVQTKQKVVWFNVMLMDTDPYQCITKHHLGSDSNSITQVSFFKYNGSSPCYQETPWPLSRRWIPSNSKCVCKDPLEPTRTRKCPPSVCLLQGNTVAALGYRAKTPRFHHCHCRLLKRASPRNYVSASGILSAGCLTLENLRCRCWGLDGWGIATGLQGHYPPPQAHCLHSEGRFLGTY